MSISLIDLIMKNNRRKLQTTVLYRKGGTWSATEVGRLIRVLETEACQNPKHPEYIILFGHHTKEATLKALIAGVDYTATPVIGADSDQLPFRTTFV
jgi:hypothetical protein